MSCVILGTCAWDVTISHPSFPLKAIETYAYEERSCKNKNTRVKTHETIKVLYIMSVSFPQFEHVVVECVVIILVQA